MKLSSKDIFIYFHTKLFASYNTLECNTTCYSKSITTFLIYSLYSEVCKIMTAAYLPSILVPIIGIIFPGFVMAFAFIYIEQDEIA